MADSNHLSEEESTWDQVARGYCESHLIPTYDIIETEKAVAVNWGTGEAKFLSIKDRQYPDLGPGWFYGTMDLLCLSGDTVYVGDWKTGGIDGAEEQLLSLLAASVRALSWLPKPPSYRYAISILEVNERGVWPHEREVSQEELNQHWQAMAWSTENLGQTYNPVQGIHCIGYFCPHLAYCQAVHENVLELSELPEAKLNKRYLLRKHKITGEPSSGEEASYTMERLSAANRQVKYLTECMKQYVRDGGAVISNGWQWRQTDRGFRWTKLKG